MVWTIKFTEVAQKQLSKLNKTISKKIIAYLKDRISKLDDPKNSGKALLHEKSGLWRYRMGDYRIICKIIESELTILVIQIGHRKNIYD